MSNLLGQLENNETILLMYLAGELPGEDRAEVEQMLASDPSLRALLTELTDLQADVTGFLAKSEPGMPAARRDAAARRVSRAMAVAQSRAAAQTAAPVAEPAVPTLRIAWWAYPIAAAAALVVAVVFLSDAPRLKIAVTQPGNFGTDDAVDEDVVAPSTYAMAEPSPDPSFATLQGVEESIADLRAPQENLIVQAMFAQE